MKKILAFFLAILIILGTLASCGGKSSDKDDPDDEYEENEDENEEKETVIGENSESNAENGGNAENDGGNTENGGESVICTQHTGGTATCTQKAICSVCGEFYGEIDPQNHTGEAKWVESSDNNHKKVYDCCTKEIVSQENHEWHDGKCVDCSYECKHSYGSWNTIKESSCTEKGSKNRKCAICSEIEEDIIDMLDHQCVTVGEIKDCGGNTVFEAKICIECGYTENLSDEPVVIHPHSFIRREPVEPTCTEEGCSVWFECENCGYDVKETIDALDHKWGGTCYRHDEIYHKYKCTRSQCNAELKELHDVNSWRVISLPTCTKDGSIGGYCVDCGQWCTKILLAGHNYDAGVETKKPTCTEKGTMLYTCTECGHTTEADVAPLGHDFQNYVLSNTNAEDPCEHVSECSRSECDAKDYKTIHDDGPWTLTNNPDNLCEHSKECSRCERRVYSTIHDFDNGTITKEPNCLEGGNKLYICQRCELEKNQSLAAYGHDEEIIDSKNPTCTEGGYTVYRCKRCANLRTAFSEALGHEGIYAYDDDCHWKKCKRCNTVLTSELEHELEVKFDKEEKESETVFSLYYLCDICGYKRIIKEGAVHVHNEAEIIPAVAPTCTECGYLPGLKCATEGCDEVFIEPEAVDALGHDYYNFNFTCTRCGLEFFSEGLKYTLSNDETYYTVTGIGTCADMYVNIPSAYNGKPVKAIEEDAFYNKDKIVAVKIPDSVTSIGEWAFYDCDSLTSVTINSGSIGYYAFAYCDNLTSITIGNGVTSIGEDAFEDCYKLVEVINKSSTLTITAGSEDNGPVAYYALEVHDGESKIKTQGDYQFYTVGGVNYLFNYIGSDTELTLPENYNGENYVINKYAFYHNYKITKVTIPDSVTSIGSSAFSNCSSLTSVTIPNSVTSIGDSAFARCDSFTSVTIGNSVTSIGDYAFAWCDSLTSVTIPNSVTSIGSSAFSYCDSLTSITVDENNTAYKSIDGNLYSKDGKTLIQYAIGKPDTSFTIPDSVTSIGYRAFEACTNLTSVMIPNSVTSIGDEAFEDCSNLTSVTIGNSVKSIGEGAFTWCDSLTSVTIPDSVTSIGKEAFRGCSSLTSVTIPNSVTSIGKEAFRACSSLTSVTIGNGVTSIGSSAFAYCDSLTSVTISNDVTSIGDWAFSGCYKLVEVIYNSDTLTITKGSASNGRVAYYALEVHDGESKIKTQGDYQFYTVNGVNYLVNYIGNDTELTLPANYNEENYVINDYAFRNNDKITKVTIPDSVTSIGSSAFSSCYSLTSVTIGNGVTSIGSHAFYYCSSLKSINYRGAEAEWNAITKGSDWNYKVPSSCVITYNYTGE